MKIYLNILLLLWIPCLLSAISGNSPASIGTLQFWVNSQLYKADSTHARGYAVRQSSLAYINGANSDMVIGVQWNGVKGPGTFLIDAREGKAEFSTNNKTYLLKQTGDYLKVTVKAVKQQGAFLLLSGTFEGQLQDRNGNKLKITEGFFETRSL